MIAWRFCAVTERVESKFRTRETVALETPTAFAISLMVTIPPAAGCRTGTVGPRRLSHCHPDLQDRLMSVSGSTGSLKERSVEEAQAFDGFTGWPVLEADLPRVPIGAEPRQAFAPANPSGSGLMAAGMVGEMDVGKAIDTPGQ